MVEILGKGKLDIEMPDFFKKPKQANLQFFILMIIQDNPTHGYEIIKKIEQRTFGKWRPSNSAIYNLLNLLTEKKYIELEKSGERDKKIDKLTEKGDKLVEIFRKEVSKLFHSLIQTLLTDDEFEIPLPAIQHTLDEKANWIFENYSKKEQEQILLKFQDTLKIKLEEVENRLKKLQA